MQNLWFCYLYIFFGTEALEYRKAPRVNPNPINLLRNELRQITPLKKLWLALSLLLGLRLFLLQNIQELTFPEMLETLVGQRLKLMQTLQLKTESLKISLEPERKGAFCVCVYPVEISLESNISRYKLNNQRDTCCINFGFPL